MPKKTLGKSRKRARKPRASAAASSRAAPTAPDRYIADQLKAIYDAVVAEPIPDQLLELLDRLHRDAEK
jgi:Anti-sigma factor NepR